MSSRTSLASVELADLSRQETSSTAGLQASLPPTDRGAGAYGFLFAAFVLEVFVWGYSYSFATILVYLQVGWTLGPESVKSSLIILRNCADTRALGPAKHRCHHCNWYHTDRDPVHAAVRTLEQMLGSS